MSKTKDFLFMPSLIWVPFGRRKREDITFPLSPVFEKKGVNFKNVEVKRIDLRERFVEDDRGEKTAYDYLVIATGPKLDYDDVPGLGPKGFTQSIFSWPDADRAREAFDRFLTDPGPVVVGGVQGASCFGAAYEFLFNTAYQLRKAGLKRQVTLTYVTAEPFLGHFGIGGLPHGESLLRMFLRKERIDSITGVAMEAVEPGAVRLTDGRAIPFRYAMIVPPFTGQDVVRKVDGLADDKGFLPVRPTYQSEKYDDVYAVGVAAAVEVPWRTAVPVGVPKTGFPTEQQAHIAARNIAAQVRGEVPGEQKEFADIPAICVMDAGNNGVIILADRMMPPRKHGVLIPGPQAHLMKLGFERYFLWKARHGYVQLP
jgi:sulfide:quinone oxidoreductase